MIPLLQDLSNVLPDSVPTVKTDLGMLRTLPVDELINRFVTGLVSLAINVVIAIIVFYIGKFVIRKIYNLVHNIMLRRRVDNSLTTFVLSFIRMLLYFILVVTVIGILGIETSSFLALFASAGVAIGMALSGTLQNFAGGVLILILKPYRVGDYIEAQGFSGTVREIQIFHTIIGTADNKSIIIPNGGLSTGSVNNWSREAYRRVDWTVGISYGDDVDTARKAILNILLSDQRIVKQYIDNVAEEQELGANDNPVNIDNEIEEPRRSFWYRLTHRHRARVEAWQQKRDEAIKAAIPRVDRSPSVVVDSLADSSVVLKVRAWTRTTLYWDVYYNINERIYDELPRSGVNFPFPQIDVHLKN